LPRFVRTPISPEQANQQVRHQFLTRGARFLSLVERAVYSYPASPYLALLRHVGCELGDFQLLVRSEGVEGALRILADRGVYLTFEELKGRTPTVRGSRQFTFPAANFDNPLVRPHVVIYSGGSGGRPTRTRYSLEYFEERAVSIAAVLDAHGVRRPRQAFWWPVPVAWILAAAKLDHPATGWFYPVHPLPPVVRWAARYLALVGWLAGCPVPSPRRGDGDPPSYLLGWLAEQLTSDRPLVLWGVPSAGVRLASAASAAGLDLRGLTFMVGGEPMTERRRQQMEAAGAQVIAVYSSVELGGLSYSCATPSASDDVHLMTDRFALVQRPRAASVGGPIVDALLFTTLSPGAGKIAINTETGDYAYAEERACGCPLGALGLSTHLSGIRSFEKVTGEGTSFVRSNLERVLEDVLPARFGGTSVDYQLAEEETVDGMTRLVLRVRPSVGSLDEALLRTTLLDAMGRGGLVDRYHAGLLRQAGSITIRREAPVATRAGKVLPFQLGLPNEPAVEPDHHR
jgi:hypothetical protein